MFYCAVARGKPFAGFFRLVVERTDPAAVSDATALINDVNSLGPRGIGVIGGVAHVIDSEGQSEVESFDEIIRNRHALLECFRLRVTNVVFEIRFHLPLVGGMRFANVNGQEIRAVLVILINLDNVAHLAAKRWSSKTPEDENEWTIVRTFANVKTADTIQRDDARVRCVAADSQCATMHVGQRVAHHAVRILGAPGHVGQSGKSGDEEHAKYSRRPFPEAFHWKLFSFYLIGCSENSIIRGRLSSAGCPVLFCSARAFSMTLTAAYAGRISST